MNCVHSRAQGRFPQPLSPLPHSSPRGPQPRLLPRVPQGDRRRVGWARRATGGPGKGGEKAGEGERPPGPTCPPPSPWPPPEVRRAHAPEAPPGQRRALRQGAQWQAAPPRWKPEVAQPAGGYVPAGPSAGAARAGSGGSGAAVPAWRTLSSAEAEGCHREPGLQPFERVSLVSWLRAGPALAELLGGVCWGAGIWGGCSQAPPAGAHLYHQGQDAGMWLFRSGCAGQGVSAAWFRGICPNSQSAFGLGDLNRAFPAKIILFYEWPTCPANGPWWARKVSHSQWSFLCVHVAGYTDLNSVFFDISAWKLKTEKPRVSGLWATVGELLQKEKKRRFRRVPFEAVMRFSKPDFSGFNWAVCGGLETFRFGAWMCYRFSSFKSPGWGNGSDKSNRGFQGPSDPKVQMDSVVEGAFALRKERACGFIPAPGAFPPVCYDVREQKIQRESEIL